MGALVTDPTSPSYEADVCCGTASRYLSRLLATFSIITQPGLAPKIPHLQVFQAAESRILGP
jgi:hypothetical protein